MRKKAFTLIEVLVVISVIALLMAILVPALAKARQQVRNIVCLSNIRHMVLAADVYTQSYDGHYPFGYYSLVSAPPFTILQQWDYTIRTDWSSWPSTSTAEPGLLWEAEIDKKIHQCPSFTGSSSSPGQKFSGYNYNISFIGSGAVESVPRSTHVGEVRKPTKTAIFGDGQLTTGGANKYMRSPLANPTNPQPGQLDYDFAARYAGAQGYRHLGKTNVAFCDGHAVSLSQLYTDTDPAGQLVLDNYNQDNSVKIGFLSSNNSMYDLK